MAAIFRGGRLTVVKPSETDLGPVTIKAPRSKARDTPRVAVKAMDQKERTREEQEA